MPQKKSFFFLVVFIYLKVRVAERETAERKRSSTHWCIHHMAELEYSQVTRSQELVSVSMWVQEPKDLDYLLLLFPGRKSIRNRAAGTRTGTHMGCLCFRQQFYLLCHSIGPKIRILSAGIYKVNFIQKVRK